ncbi:MAG: hypothetical protein HQK83_16675 [Fibrobacteria bacterium]|nr:hypothetical protein [Fibrobacteria bacterium]
MFYKIDVKNDGDIFVSKVERIPGWAFSLHLQTIDQVANELIDYGAEEIEENIRLIKSAAMYEDVRCY